MKKIKLFTKAVETAFGAVVVLYALMLVRLDSDLPYIRYAMALGMVIMAAGVLGFFVKKPVLRILFILMDVCFYALFCSFVAFSLFIMTGMYAKAPDGCDYMIVPGAAVNGTKPSEALEKRIERAYEYMSENPKTVCIAAGAVEEDGEISEAECIAKGLVERGIDSDRIVREELSTTTVENMKNACTFIQGADNGICVVTNGFHVARSCMILKNFTEFKVYGCSASGLSSYSPYNMTREFVVFLIDVQRGNYAIKF